MRLRLLIARAAAVLVLLLAPVALSAQSTLTSATISTSGADCSTATACADFDVSGVAAFALYLNVGTSGTFNWEASVDATTLTGGTWFAVTDDVDGTSSATADGAKFFTNPGYRRFRVRASAISGNATVDAHRGVASARASVASIAAGDTNIGNVDVVSLIPGTGATNAGKAEDAAHTTADTATPILGVRNDGGSTQATSATGDYGNPAIDAYGAMWVRNDHPNQWTASLDAIGATLTELKAAPGASLSLYIMSYMAGSTTGTAGQHLLRYGTGTNCGTGTTTLFPGTGTTARVPSPVNTAAPTVVQFIPPIKVTANNAICLLGVATNTTWMVMSGFTAP